MLKNTESTYGSVAKTFHWLIFLLVAALLTVGFLMTGMDASPDKFKIYGLHKSFGILVLALMALRLGWRLINISPTLPDNMRRIEKLGAHAAHWALYALIIAMPLSGWMMSSASGFPVSVFGLAPLPDLVAADKVLKGILCDAHELLAYAIIALVTLHALAALLHHFYHKDNVLRRMLPWCLAIVFFGVSSAHADVPAWQVVKEKSFIKFFAIQNNAPVEGRFSDFTADIRFDADHLDQSHIGIEVATGSVSVANDDVEKTVVLPDWLSVDAFPKAVFKSEKINRTPMTNDYFVEGDLTLRGKTAPVTLNFTLKQTGNVAIATGFVTLRRNAFGVGQGEWQKDDVIKNEVRVEFRIFAEKK